MTSLVNRLSTFVLPVALAGALLTGALLATATPALAARAPVAPATAVAPGYFGVDFITTNAGWVVGASGTVLATTNGGKAWQTQTAAAGAASLLDVCVLSDGKNGWAVGAGGTVLHMTDGKTWTRVFSSAFDASYSFTAVEFVTAKTGWIAGGVAAGPLQGTPRGAILRTTDGGQTWRAAAVSAGWCPVALDAVSATSAVCAGVQRVGTGATGSNAPAAVRTTDGATWTSPTLLRPAVSATGEVGGVAMNGARAVVVGDFCELLPPTPICFTSTSAGATYAYAAGARSGPTQLRGVSLVSAAGALAVGTGNAAVLRSVNGGASWTAVSAPLAKNLYAVDFVDANAGFAAGRTSAGTAATVLKTTNGGSTWTVVK